MKEEKRVLIDVHCHIGAMRDIGPRRPGCACVISRGPQDNARCIDFARTRGLVCALFAQPATPSWAEVCGRVRRREALAYVHPDRIRFADRRQLEPVLRASRNARVPLIVHVSRHDRERVPPAQAASWLDYLIEAADGIPLIVSHAGGENCREVLRRARVLPNILLDLSLWEQTAVRAGCSGGDEMLRILADSIAPTQYLFGSDKGWPAPDEVGARVVAALQPTLGDAATLLNGNARRVLGNCSSLPPS
jgi:hypothetical protein